MGISNLLARCALAAVLAFVLGAALAHSANLSITPSSFAADSGQTETINIYLSGGMGPFNVGIFNTTGGGRVGNIVTISAPYVVNSVAGYEETQELQLPPGYGLYLCGAASSETFSLNESPFSWSNDQAATYIFGGDVTSVGHQTRTNNVCSTSVAGLDPLVQSVAITGIALNESPGSYELYSRSFQESVSAGQEILDYNISNPGTFVVILIAVGGGTRCTSGGPLCSITQLPDNCRQVIFLNSSDQSESVYMALCSNQTPRSVPYGVGELQEGGTYTSMAAYVFNSPPKGGTAAISFTVTANAVGVIGLNAIARDTSNGMAFNSVPVSLQVSPDPTVTASLAGSNTIYFNQSASFNAAATEGAGDPSTYQYQWYLDGGTYNTPIPEATTRDYAYQGDSAGLYTLSVSATDNAGYTAYSNQVQLALEAPPVIISLASDPQFPSIDVGQSITFTNSTLINGVPAAPGDQVYYAYQITPPVQGSYTVENNIITFNAVGIYYVSESAEIRGYTSNSEVIDVSVNTLPVPYINPPDSIIDFDQNEWLNAGASGGTGPFAFNFVVTNQTSGKVLGTWTGSMILLNGSALIGGSDIVTVTVTDGSGETSSSSTSVTVDAAPSISVSPLVSTLNPGQTQAFTIGVTGGAGPFSVGLYSATDMVQYGNSIMIPSGGSNTMIFASDLPGNYSLDVVATDQGTTQSFPVVSNAISVTVSNAAQASTTTSTVQTTTTIMPVVYTVPTGSTVSTTTTISATNSVPKASGVPTTTIKAGNAATAPGNSVSGSAGRPSQKATPPSSSQSPLMEVTAVLVIGIGAVAYCLYKYRR